MDHEMKKKILSDLMANLDDKESEKIAPKKVGGPGMISLTRIGKPMENDAAEDEKDTIHDANEDQRMGTKKEDMDEDDLRALLKDYMNG